MKMPFETTHQHEAFLFAIDFEGSLIPMLFSFQEKCRPASYSRSATIGPSPAPG